MSKFLNTILLFCVTFSAVGQIYNFNHYNVEDGLAQSQVLSMCQDKKGNMWFGTNNGGVSRFNGKDFVTYTEKDGLGNNVVFSIIESNEGTIYFGTNDGLTAYDGFTFQNFVPDTVDLNRVYNVFEDSKNNLWICMHRGLYQFKEGIFAPFGLSPAFDEATVWSMYEDSQGNLWFGTMEHGVFRYNGIDLEHFFTEQGLRDNPVLTINEDKEGGIWVGTTKGLHTFDVAERKFKENRLGGDVENYGVTVTSSHKDDEGILWFSTRARIYYYDGDTIQSIGPENGLPGHQFWCVMSDREGNVWFGSNGNGISNFLGKRFINYNEDHNLSHNVVQAIYETKNGDVWVGCREKGLSRFDGRTFHQYFRKEINEQTIFFPGENVWSMHQDQAGKVWFGSRPNVSVYDGSTFKKFPDEENPLFDLGIYAITEDKAGNLLFGTEKGAFKYNGTSFESLTDLNENIEERDRKIWSIFVDDKGTYWLGTEYGALSYDKFQVRHYTSKDGFVTKRVNTILQDAQGYYWFGTDEGVFRYDLKKDEFKSINEDNGLSANKVYLMIFDLDGNLWVGTNKGLNRIDIAAFNNEGEMAIKHYGAEEGFIGVECNSNAAFRDRQGRLWFGTNEGVTIYNPKEDKKEKVAPITSITDIKLYLQDNTDFSPYSDGFDKTTGLPTNLVLPHDQNHITFEFIGISLANPEKVRYRFMLKGQHGNWLQITKDNKTTVTPDPGEYTFIVESMNADGIWNREPATFSFVIAAPWYATNIAYAGFSLSAIGLFYLIFTIRTKSLQRSKRLLEAQVDERTKELREEKEKVEEINIEVLNQKALIEEKNRDITDSINYAKRIQEAVLPGVDNIYKSFSEAFVLYLPKDIVSGDFYWHAERDEHAIIAAVDCTGHGVPGAFMSMIGNNLMNQIILENKVHAPGEILAGINNGIRQAFKGGKNVDASDGMDMALCVYDKGNKALNFAGAQRPLYKIANEEFSEIKGTKSPIGGITKEGAPFEMHTIPVKEGDCFYICSDGYADQFGGDRGKKLMSKHFKKFLTEIHLEPMITQKDLLLNYLNEWKGDYEQVDDILVIGFRI